MLHYNKALWLDAASQWLVLTEQSALLLHSVTLKGIDYLLANIGKNIVPSNADILDIGQK